MPDDLLSSPIPLPPRRAGVSSRGLLLAMLLAFAGGTVLAGWLIWDGRVSMADLGLRQPAVPAPRLAALPAPSPSPVPAIAPLEARLGALETQVTRIEGQLGSAQADTARARGLLVAFAFNAFQLMLCALLIRYEDFHRDFSFSKISISP